MWGSRERVQNHAGLIERQWNIRVTLNIDEAAEELGAKVTGDIYRLIHEGLVNAARHADASIIRVHLSVADGRVHLSIADDGKGFPFTGTYDLEWLERMDQGPVTLRERVAALQGELTLTSSKQAGSELLITVPPCHRLTRHADESGPRGRPSADARGAGAASSRRVGIRDPRNMLLGCRRLGCGQ